MKYKPREIEAMRFDGSKRDAEAVVAWAKALHITNVDSFVNYDDRETIGWSVGFSFYDPKTRDMKDVTLREGEVAIYQDYKIVIMDGEKFNRKYELASS